MAHTIVELTWISFLLHDLGVHLSSPPILFCDNLSALHMTVNLVFHARSKYIEINYYYVHEQVAIGLLQTWHVPAPLQLEDIFTKPLRRPTLYSLHTKLDLLPQHNLRGSIENTQGDPVATTPNMAIVPITPIAQEDPTAKTPNMEITEYTDPQKSTNIYNTLYGKIS